MVVKKILVDFHVHVFPEILARKVIPELSLKSGVELYSDGTLSDMLKVSQTAGIEKVVIQPIATKASQVTTINQWMLKIKRETGMFCFGALHPDLSEKELEEQINFLNSHSFKGVKLHPEYQNFYPDEDRLEKIYLRLSQAKLGLLIHSGKDLSYSPPFKGTPKRILQINKSFPELKLIVAHMGGFLMWEEAEKHLIGKNLYLDTAFCVKYLSREYFEVLVKAHGSERILWGTDMPWGNPQKHLDYILKADLNSEETNNILGQNAVDLLAIDKN